MFRKKLFSLLLCTALVLQMICVPQAAVYADSGKWDGSVDLTWYEEQGGASASDLFTGTDIYGIGLVAALRSRKGEVVNLSAFNELFVAYNLFAVL